MDEESILGLQLQRNLAYFSAKVMPLIYITAPNNIFYTFELPVMPGAEVYVGTAPNCQLALPGVEGLGEVHACIACQPQGYVITDMGTPYGTLANGMPIQADFLRPGIEYRLGAAVITLPAEGAAAPQQAAPMAAMPMQQSAPMPAAPQQAAAPAPATKQPALKKKSPLKTGGVAKPGAGAAKGAAASADITAMADRFKRKGDSALFNMIYVVVLIAAAVYAGMALRHWQRTGNFLPGIVADGEPSK